MDGVWILLVEGLNLVRERGPDTKIESIQLHSTILEKCIVDVRHGPSHACNAKLRVIIL